MPAHPAGGGGIEPAQTATRAQGHSLKVCDCYRPARAGEDFAAWVRDPHDQTMKGEFYPDEDKSKLFADGYVGSGMTSHSGGTAMDLTLVPLPEPTQRAYVPGEPLVSYSAPAAQRFPDNSVDMGTGYDCFDARSHTMDSRITRSARDNRLLLRRLMTDAGFVTTPTSGGTMTSPTSPVRASTSTSPSPAPRSGDRPSTRHTRAVPYLVVARLAS
ncbi:MAG: zinc D-Ala-D-Ala dipeptidase [Micromonosporaceae bacterium]|nr:zinc D-Ala-D-Ala dipeptidase [Micromonosporaceae bacterium]